MKIKKFKNILNENINPFDIEEDDDGIIVKVNPKTKTEEDDYEIGYFTDDYDIVAKAPITKSFKVKVKIRSISRLQPKYNRY